MIKGGFRLWGDFEYPDNCVRGNNWVKFMKYRDGLTQTRGYNLDFFALKNGRECVVEVKTNTGQLVESQRKLLEYAKDMGYVPILIRSKVDIIGEVTKITEL